MREICLSTMLLVFSYCVKPSAFRNALFEKRPIDILVWAPGAVWVQNCPFGVSQSTRVATLLNNNSFLYYLCTRRLEEVWDWIDLGPESLRNALCTIIAEREDFSLCEHFVLN